MITKKEPITRDERIRRVGFLCVHFVRNLAFYRAGMENGILLKTNPFWRTANFNFFDQAVLEWCKLFADKKGKHYWGKIATDCSKFQIFLCETIRMDNDEFEVYVNELRKSRDKFIAHLDSERHDYRPHMDIAYKCIEYYYQHLFNHDNKQNCLSDFPSDLKVFYDKCFQLAEAEYKT
ncbi:hypothetical protein [Moritella sp. PE36]|uniref:hypothetical protein n=1 Tax=Moritella sp. PE36 TaxID=58051 RepID=UPI0005C5E4B9|nr:hypothetical protein [Moritella sp. PE36]